MTLGPTYAVRDPARLPETVRDVLDDDSGYELLILGGGDGSVSSVVDFLAHHDITLSASCLLGRLTTSRALLAYRRTSRGVPDHSERQGGGRGPGPGGRQLLRQRRLRGAWGGGDEGALALDEEERRASGVSCGRHQAFLKHEPFSAGLTFPDRDHEAVEYERLCR